MASNPFIHLRSAKLVILPNEDDEILNEGMYGKSLCLYLQDKLAQRGWAIDFVGSEDWGWLVGVGGHAFRLGVCVYGIEMEDGGLDLCVTVMPERRRQWSWSRFRFVDTTDVVNRLIADLQSIFAEDRDVQLMGCTEEFPIG